MEIPLWVFVILVCATVGFIGLLISFITLVLAKCVRDGDHKKAINGDKSSIAFYGLGHTTYIPLALSYTAIQGESSLHSGQMMNYVPPITNQKLVRATSFLQQEMPQSFNVIPEETYGLAKSPSPDSEQKNLQKMRLRRDLSDSQKSLTLFAGSISPMATNGRGDVNSPPGLSVGSADNDERPSSRESNAACNGQTHPSPLPTLNDPHAKVITTASQQTDDLFISYDSDFTTTGKNTAQGVLNFALCYAAESLELTVYLKRAVNLSAASGESTQFYVCLCVVPEDFLWQKSAVQDGSCDPVFNEEFHIEDVLPHKMREYSLCLMVMRVGQSHDRVVGRVLVHLSDLRADMVVDMWRELTTD